MHRLFLTPQNQVIHPQQKRMTITLTDEQSHYLNRVIRIEVRDTLEVVGATVYWIGQCLDIAKRTITLDITDERPLPPSPPLRITLAQSLPKQDKMAEILRSCTEVGVSEFIPIVTERTIVKPKDAEGKLTRWEQVVLHATMQSQRYQVPKLHTIGSIDTLVNVVPAYDIGLVFWEDELQHTLSLTKAFLSEHQFATALIVIGPEGGLSAQEVGRLVAAGFSSVRMNTSILRVEHAGLVACAQLLAQLY